MSEQDRRLINRVLIEYYEGGYTQREISEMEHISRSSICRILQRARAEKLVRFEFNLFADESADQLARELRERLALESVRVVPCYLDDPTSRLRGVASALAAELNRLLLVGDTVGLGEGKTLRALSRCLVRPESPIAGLCFTTLAGFAAQAGDLLDDFAAVAAFAAHYGGRAAPIPAPGVADTEELAQLLRRAPRVAEALDAARAARVAVFSVDSLSEASSHLDGEAVKALSIQGAVGNVLLHYFNGRGELIDASLERRLTGLSWQEIREKELRILIVTEEEKAHAAVCAAAAGICTDLYVDDRTARRMLSLLPQAT